MSIYIFSKNVPRSWMSIQTLKKIIRICQKTKLVPKKTIFVSLSAVGRQEMVRLNFKYRGKRKPTDVLSFEQRCAHAPKGVFFLGDIVFCKDVVRKQAKTIGHSVRKEMAMLLTHGVLHLLGFDHEHSHAHATRMKLQESKILRKLYRRRVAGLMNRI